MGTKASASSSTGCSTGLGSPPGSRRRLLATGSALVFPCAAAAAAAGPGVCRDAGVRGDAVRGELRADEASMRSGADWRRCGVRGTGGGEGAGVMARRVEAEGEGDGDGEGEGMGAAAGGEEVRAAERPLTAMRGQVMGRNGEGDDAKRKQVKRSERR